MSRSRPTPLVLISVLLLALLSLTRALAATDDLAPSRRTLQAPPPPAATYTVNLNTDEPDANPADNVCDVNLAAPGSQCTLRAAIQTANTHLGFDWIVFALGPGTPTITVGETPGPSQGQQLPQITDPVNINGNTGGARRVQITTNLTIFAIGLPFNAGSDGSWVQSVVVNSFFGNAVEFYQTNGNTIRDSYLGLDPSGTQAPGDLGAGLSINQSSNNLVGGPSDADRNVISGNGFGIDITGPATGNVVEGNYIGTDYTGTVARGNLVDGIILGGAANNTIGGTAVIKPKPQGTSAGCISPCNVISANASDGIEISVNVNEGNNVIQGNYIGTDVSGNNELGNGDNGILLRGSPGNLVGGSSLGQGNLISGNSQDGVLFQFANNTISGLVIPTGNRIWGNLIGTQADGTTALGNHQGGVYVQGGYNNQIGGTANTDTGGCYGACNVIAFNGSDNAGDGVDVVEPSIPIVGNIISYATGNSIRRNSIYSNYGLGIDLADDGVTPNDEDTPNDQDTGPNLRQNYPTLFTVTATNAQGTLESTPNTTFTLDFYSNAVCDPSHYGEGQTWIGSTRVTTNSAGHAAFNFPFQTSVSPTEDVTATATDPRGNTSEFSNCLVVGGMITPTPTPTGPTPTLTPSVTPQQGITPSPTPGQASADLSIAKSDSPDPVAPGAQITYQITITNHGPNDASEVSFGDNVPANTTFVSVSASPGGTCSGPSSTGFVGCGWPGPTAPGATRSVTFVVRVNSDTPPGTVIYNTGGTGSRTNDPNFNNNQATTQTLVAPATATPTPNPGADLSIRKNGQAANGGSPIVFILTVTNQGPSVAENVRIRDVLKDVIEYESSSATRGKCGYLARRTVVICHPGTLGPRETVTVRIVTRLVRFEQVFQNCGRTRSSTGDPYRSNNRTCITVQLGQDQGGPQPQPGASPTPTATATPVEMTTPEPDSAPTPVGMHDSIKSLWDGLVGFLLGPQETALLQP